MHRAAAFWLLCALAFAHPAAAQRQQWDNEEVTLVFDQRIRSIALEVNQYYPGVKQELEQVFGWTLRVKPTVVLIAARSDFQRLVPNPLFVAVALPSQNAIVIDTSRTRSAPLDLRVILAHEMAHLLLHQYIERSRLPRWLDEGVCQWFTGGVTEILIDPHRSVLGEALGSGEYIALADITSRFPSDPRKLMLAYEQSRDIVTMIANRFGSEKLLGILHRLHNGESIEAGVRSELGVTLEDLEKTWQRKLTGGVMWWGRLAANLYGILFFLAALLAVAGFAVQMYRRKKRFREEDEEDRQE